MTDPKEAPATPILTTERVALFRHAMPFVDPPTAQADFSALCDSHEALRARLSRAEQERDEAAGARDKHRVAREEHFIRMQAAEAEVARLRDALENYGDHDSGCIRAKYQAGRPTADGRYEMNFGGQWYEVRPNDCAPACTCGFSAALSAQASDAEPCWMCKGKGRVGPYERETPDGLEGVREHACPKCGGRSAQASASKGGPSVSDRELCGCEFDPALDDDGEGSWHYARKCLHCGVTWGGLHCPHDGYQNPCPGCGVRPTPVPNPSRPSGSGDDAGEGK